MSASMVPSWQRLPGQPVHRETSRSKAALTTAGVWQTAVVVELCGIWPEVL